MNQKGKEFVTNGLANNTDLDQLMQHAKELYFTDQITDEELEL